MISSIQVVCSRCGCEQTLRPACRRCEKKLPDVVVVVREEVVEKVVEKQIPALDTCACCGSVSGEIPTVETAERNLIRAAIDATGGDAQRAAKMLGIGKTTIYRKLREMEPQCQ